MRVLLYLILVFILASCSMFKSKKQKHVERTIASIEPNQLKVDEIDGNLFVSINFEVFGKHKGDNTFEIKAPYGLDNDVKYRLPYEIIVNSSDINCISNSSFKEIHKNYQYRNEGTAVNNKLKCVYEGIEDKKVISATYVFHKLKNISILEANSFIHPVSREAQDASRILKSVKRGDDVGYYDSRLLFDFFADKQTVSFDPKKSGNSFHLKLSRKDVVQISAPTGEIHVPKLGVFNHRGAANRKYIKKGNAGKKYFHPTKVQPYELTCSVLYVGKSRVTIERFRWSDSIQIKDAHEIKCGFNTRKISKKKLKKIKGSISLKIAVVRYKDIKKKVSDYLAAPQIKLNKYIEDLNKSNLESVTSYAQRTIDAQINKVEKETVISKYFPFTKNVDLKIKEIILDHQPRLSKVVHEDKVYKYLDYDVYATPKMVDSKGVSSKPGKVFLGTVQTKYTFKGSNYNLHDHEIFKVFCGKQYETYFLPRFVELIKTNEEGEKKPISLNEYKEFIESVPRKLCGSEADFSSPIETTIRRQELHKCAEVSGYERVIARNVEERGQLTFDKVVAGYDLFEGVHSEWSLSYYVLAKEELPIKKPITIKSDKKLDQVESCVFISDEKAIQLLKD